MKRTLPRKLALTRESLRRLEREDLATSIPRRSSGATTMKMIRSTRQTSTSGPARRRRRLVPEAVDTAVGGAQEEELGLAGVDRQQAETFERSCGEAAAQQAPAQAAVRAAHDA
jgi:hypothetical protein